LLIVNSGLRLRALASLMVLLLGLAASLSGSDETTTLSRKFTDANQAYSNGNYAEAVRGYEELIKIVGPSADLYYNLGCAALKAGHLGVAVVNFHRAERLAPRDEDIRANLKFVQALSKAEGEEENEGNSFIIKTVLRWVFLLTDREVAYFQLASLIWFAAGITFLALGYSGSLRQAVIVITAAGFFLLVVNSTIMGIHLYRDYYVHEAVVVKANAEARSGPGEDNMRVLVMPEGTLIRLRDTRGNWVLVSLPSGRSGWLKSDVLEEI